MARIRSIKPTFWTDETMGNLKIPTVLHYVGLWNYVDDDGKGLDNPRLIKAAIWPLRDEIGVAEIEEMQAELAAWRRIIRWTESGEAGRRLFQIPLFRKHQKPQHPTRSDLPDPPFSLNVEHAPTSITLMSAHESDNGSESHQLSGSSHLRVEEGRGRVGENTLRPEAALKDATGDGPESAASVCAPRFDFRMFWDRWPVVRRVGEAAAERAWREITAANEPSEVVAGADRWAAYWTATGTPPRYIPRPENWLRQRKWSEDPPPLRNGVTADMRLIRMVERFVEGDNG